MRAFRIRLCSPALALLLCAAGVGCATAAPRPVPTVPDLSRAPDGAYLSGAFAGLGDPSVINRRDFIYALAFTRRADELAFVHHVSTNMELTATGLNPVKPRFQSPVNSSEFDIEDVVILERGPGAGLIVVPSRQGILRAFDRALGTQKMEHAVGVPLVRVAASPSGALLAVGTHDGRVLLLDPGTFSRVAEAQPFGDEVRGLAFVDDATVVATSFDGKLLALSVQAGAEPLARAPTGQLKSGERVFLGTLGEPGKGPMRGISTVRDTRQPSTTVSAAAVKRLGLSPIEGEATVITAEGEKRVPRVDLGRYTVGVLTLGTMTAGVCDVCVPIGAELSLGQDALARASFTDDIAHDEILVKPTEAADKATVIDNARSLVVTHTIPLPGPGTDVDVARSGAVVVSFSATRAERSFDLYEAEKSGDYPEPSPKSGAAIADLAHDKLGPVFMGHRGFTVSASISPDGRTVATGGWDKRVLVFDVGSGQQVAERELAWLVRRVRFSPNGALLGVAAWTPVNVMNEGNSDPALLLYPLTLDTPTVAGP